MRLFHLSDLHIGKIVNTYQLLQNQEYISHVQILKERVIKRLS